MELLSPSSSVAINVDVVGGSLTGMKQSQSMVLKSKSATVSSACLESQEVDGTKALVAELCRHFCTLGWESGTGGSITIKVHDESVPRSHQLIVMSPSGISVSQHK